MKKIVLAAVGTRGDVLPAIALGARLSGASAVSLIAPPENRAGAERAGLRFLGIGKDFSGVVAGGDLGEYRGQIALQFSEHRAELESADEIVGLSLYFAAASWAERTGARAIQVFYTPQVFRSRLLGPPGSRCPYAAPASIALARAAQELQEDLILKRTINEGRAELALPPLRHASEARRRARQVLAVDPEIATPPRDAVGVAQAHYWRSPGGEGLVGDVADFLHRGRAPFLITLGSVAGAVRGSLALMRSAAARLEAAGERVVVVHPYAGESPCIKGKTLEARRLDFDEALPLCAAIAHHGGLGTLYAAALAGIPQLVLPCMLDQYFWAARVRELGLGSAENGPSAMADEGFAGRLVALGGDGEARAASASLAAILASPGRERERGSRVEGIFGGEM